MIEFYKYHGAGNDFIMIDNVNHSFKGDKLKLAQRLCDRHIGIGSDGIIFIENSFEVDFKMDFYNPDGSQSFCGNGSRCAVAFANLLNTFKKTWVEFEAIDGFHNAKLSANQIRVSMQSVSDIRTINNDIFMYTGSPHYMIQVDDINTINLLEIGKSIRYAKIFEPDGTNVNLIQNLDMNKIAIRTYERGVENETYACGTGATAAALAYAQQNNINTGIIDVKAVGGDLKVYFTQTEFGYDQIYLEGPTEFVFKGIISE